MTQGQLDTVREERIEGKGSTKLFVRSWHPTARARGVVAIIPGFNSHSKYYGAVGEQLAAEGLVVYAVDLRGRGKSDGERFYVGSFADYVDDAANLVKLAKSREPGLPVYLLGHSAGGVVSCLYALDHQNELAGLICESFAFKVPAPDFAISVLKGLAHVAPHAHVLHLKNEDFSRDAAVVRAMNEDPLIANETQPTQTVAEMAREADRIVLPPSQSTRSRSPRAHSCLHLSPSSSALQFSSCSATASSPTSCSSAPRATTPAGS